MELNRDVDRLITRKELQKYFAGESDSPYGTKKFHKARTEL